jgi:F-type H+-transporting ATPase subunit epsilon
MANTFKLEIVTPEAKTYSDDVEMVTLPGVEGEMGVYPQHVPLMTQMVPGEIIVHKNGQDTFLAVGDGFVEITADRVAILTDMAIQADNIDEAKAEEARRKAEARLAENMDAEESATVHASLAQSLAQLDVKRRRSRR